MSVGGNSMDNRNTYKIHEDENNIGEVHIADDVVAKIAALAASEIDGVSSMSSQIKKELVEKLGMKNSTRGVNVEICEDTVSVMLSLNLKYGYNVIDVSTKVQNKVKAAIENMTGLNVADVNVRIAGVDMEKTK